MTPRKKHRLTKLRIDEISAVDRGANDGAKIVLWKRDDTGDEDAPRRPDFRSIFGAKTPRDADENSNPDHRVSQLADLIAEASDGKIDRPTALRFLLHGRRGAAMLTRMSKQSKQKEIPMPNRAQGLAAVAKQYGVAAIAKLIVDEQNAQGISEHELCKMFTAAIERRGNETREQAFSRCFSANDEAGVLMRKAINVAKAFPAMMSVAPTQVGGKDATDVNDGAKAYTQLMELAQEQRQRSPELTIEQAFAQVYQAQENAALAGRERLNNRPRV